MAETKTKAAAAHSDTSKPADIPPANEFETSGSPVQVTDFDPKHPAIDNDPRAGTSVEQNRADFNDPTKDGRDVVEEQLKV